jgi:hypothetical protein
MTQTEPPLAWVNPLRRHSRGRVIARHVVGTGKALLQRLDHKVAAPE